MSPDWMCSVSTYINGYLPLINNRHKTVPFLPGHALCIKSSTCINQRTIPLRTIDLYKEFGEVSFTGRCGLMGKNIEIH